MKHPEDSHGRIHKKPEEKGNHHLQGQLRLVGIFLQYGPLKSHKQNIVEGCPDSHGQCSQNQ